MSQTALRRGSQDEGNTDYFTGCPIGGGFMWFGLPSKIPSNCRICNNSTLAIASYTKLNENLGGAWGTSGGLLNLPDLRGRFPRGVDSAAANDPDRASRTANATGGNTGDNVGSIQADGAKVTIGTNYANYNGAVNVSYFSSSTTLLNGNVEPSWQVIGSQTHGGNESRPKNANVYFVIRVS